MQVTFLLDHQSYLSGNSFYAAGAKADFPNVAVLVEQGIVREGWGAPSSVAFDAAAEREEIASEPAAIDNAPSPSVDWTEVRGVSTEIADAMLGMGMDSKDAFLSFFMAGGIEAITKIPAVGMKRARDLIAYAQKG